MIDPGCFFGTGTHAWGWCVWRTWPRAGLARSESPAKPPDRARNSACRRFFVCGAPPEPGCGSPAVRCHAGCERKRALLSCDTSLHTCTKTVPRICEKSLSRVRLSRTSLPELVTDKFNSPGRIATLTEARAHTRPAQVPNPDVAHIGSPCGPRGHAVARLGGRHARQGKRGFLPGAL